MLRIVRVSDDALDALEERRDDDRHAQVWLEENAHFAVDNVADELRLYAPNEIVFVVELISVVLNGDDVARARAHLRATRNRIREHLGIER